jgi:dipeptidyl aminopeptidase/acylaminoacyl peptidase
LSVFHYGTGGEADLSYEFLKDAEKYPPYPECEVPTLIFHGTQDDLVPVANSAHFVAAHTKSRLVRLNSGHELTDVLDEIWTSIQGLFPPC